MSVRPTAAPAARRILHLEDDSSDAELVAVAVASSGVGATIVHVSTRADFEDALRTGGWSLILADHRLPGFSGTEALALVRERDPETPFVFVSGSIGEEQAVDALRRGATDYVLKDRLSRLPDAVRRAIHEAEERQQLREVEGRLAESERRFRLFMERNPAAAYIKDEDGRYLYVNETAERFLGGRLDEVRGRTAFDFLPRDDADRLRRGELEILGSGRVLETEESLAHAGGRRTDWSLLRFPIPESSGRTLLGGIAIDITERKRLEEQFLHAQRMEAVGRLAGGVAHDFNNLLTVINGYAEMLERRTAPADPSRTLLAEIRAAGERATALSRQLLTFSRRQVVQVVVLDLNSLVHRMSGMLRRLLGEQYALDVLRGHGPVCVRADPGQLEQVLMNLAVNARDATPAGGRIAVETEIVTCDAPRQGDRGDVPAGRWAVLAVRDTGTGMSDEVLERVFEPFFTTKEPGKGTGLGLATVADIVKRAGGHVRVLTEVGRGTSFEVHLPWVDEVPVPTAGVSDEGMPPGGRETVLLAEDHDGVRSFLRQVLAGHGYQVLEARDGAEALDVRARHDGRVHLLVSDTVMPSLTGPELAAHLRREDPSLRVLLLSGYADADISAADLEVPGTAFLQKPFSAETLLKQVRRLLVAPTAPA